MEISKEQYIKLRDLTKQIDIILDEVRGISSENDEEADYWRRRMAILADVMLNGGIVTEEEWGDIGKSYNRDRRGLGGYFAGEKRSMVKVGNDKRAITESGVKEVKAWLDGRWDVKPSKGQLEKYKELLDDKSKANKKE